MSTEVVTIELRRGLAADWTANNPVLTAGEPGFETDTLRFKIGNGTTAWVSLAYQGALTEATEPFTLTPTDITNKYVDLAHTPAVAANTHAFLSGSGPMTYTDDFQVITNGTTVKRLSWNGLALETILVSGMKLISNYWY